MTTTSAKTFPAKPVQSPSAVPLLEVRNVTREPEVKKPQSIKNAEWKDWPAQSYSIFTDDFVHEKLATLKVNFKGRLGAASFKQNLSADHRISDEVKLWFNVQNDKSLYTKVTSKGQMRLHYDNGLTTISNRNWNFYGNFKTSKDFVQSSFAVGARHLSAACDSDNKVKVANDGGLRWKWMHRTLITHNKITFGVYTAFDITRRLLTNNSLLFGYKFDDNTSFHLRQENAGWRAATFDYADWKKYFDTYAIDLVRKVDTDTKVGIQVLLEPKSKVFKYTELVLERAIPKAKTLAKVKLHVGDELNASAVVKSKVSLWDQILNLSVGVHGEKLSEKNRTFKYGVQFQFNV